MQSTTSDWDPLPAERAELPSPTAVVTSTRTETGHPGKRSGGGPAAGVARLMARATNPADHDLLAAGRPLPHLHRFGAPGGVMAAEFAGGLRRAPMRSLAPPMTTFATGQLVARRPINAWYRRLWMVPAALALFGASAAAGAPLFGHAHVTPLLGVGLLVGLVWLITPREKNLFSGIALLGYLAMMHSACVGTVPEVTGTIVGGMILGLGSRMLAEPFFRR